MTVSMAPIGQLYTEYCTRCSAVRQHRMVFQDRRGKTNPISSRHTCALYYNKKPFYRMKMKRGEIHLMQVLTLQKETYCKNVTIFFFSKYKNFRTQTGVHFTKHWWTQMRT